MRLSIAIVLVVVSASRLLTGASGSPTRPTFRYGVVVTNTGNDGLASQLGFGWVKVFVSWNDSEPSRGVYDYPNDYGVVFARANNLHVLALVYDTPAWANGSGHYIPNSPPPTNPADFGDFMAHLAAHFRGQIDAYEIWNEENTSSFWGGQFPDPQRYANMLKAVYPAVKAADPGALVVSGGVAYTADGGGSSIGDLSYLQAMLQDGAASKLDAIGIHPYPGSCSPSSWGCGVPGGAFFRRAEQEHAAVAGAGAGSTPLWITEAGYFSQPGAIDPGATACDSGNGLGDFQYYEVDETAKATYLVQMYQYAYQNWPWLGMLMLADLDTSTDWWLSTCDPTRFWSIVTSTGQPTAAYSALQRMRKDVPQVVISPAGSVPDARTNVTISGAAFDPAAASGSGIDAVVVSVDAPYSPRATLAPVATGLSSPDVVPLYGGQFATAGFRTTVDTEHLRAYYNHAIYIYAHSSTSGWVSGSGGFYQEPVVGTTPEQISFWIDPEVTTSATTRLTLERNDGNPEGFGWNATTDASWLTLSRPGTPWSALDVIASTAGLAPGRYAGSIVIEGGDPTTSGYFRNFPVIVPVQLTVGRRFTSYLPLVPNGRVPFG